MPNVAATQQEKYSDNMYALLKEDRGGELRTICQVETGNGATHKFYRIGASSTSTTIDQYETGYVGTGGPSLEKEVAVSPAYFHDKIAKVELMQTNLDLNSAYIKSGVRAVKRSDDINVIESIENEPLVTVVGPQDGTSLGENVKDFLRVVQERSAMVENTEFAQDVLIAINAADYASLAVTDEFLSSDFMQMVHGGGNDRALKARFVRYKGTDVVAPGRVYIIPAGTVGYAEWENDGGLDATIDWHNGDKKYWLTAESSMASTPIDEEEIYIYDLEVVAFNQAMQMNAKEFAVAEQLIATGDAKRIKEGKHRKAIAEQQREKISVKSSIAKKIHPTSLTKKKATK